MSTLATGSVTEWYNRVDACKVTRKVVLSLKLFNNYCYIVPLDSTPTQCRTLDNRAKLNYTLHATCRSTFTQTRVNTLKRTIKTLLAQ